MANEARCLEFKLAMPLEFNEDEFRERTKAAVYAVVRDFGGRVSSWSMSHGTLSRAEHYAALAQEARRRSAT